MGRHQSSGVVEMERDLLKMIVNMGASSVDKSFSVRDRISSEPAAYMGIYVRKKSFYALFDVLHFRIGTQI